MEMRNRVIEMKQIDSSEIHPKVQGNMMHVILKDIGISGALVAYYSERNDGALTIIDGHMRKNMGGQWPVCITDLTDEEADKLLTVHDPVGMLAVRDTQKFEDLRAGLEEIDKGIQAGLEQLFGSEEPHDEEKPPVEQQQTQDELEEKIPEMELQPYEHYDYVLVLARNTTEWNELCDILQLRREEGSPDVRYSKVGLGRGVPASKLLQLLKSNQ
jgi:hypothetical protein